MASSFDFTLNGSPFRSRASPPHHAAPLPPRPRAHREQARLRRGRLRRLHGGAGGPRRAGKSDLPRHQQLHRAAPHGRGARGRHRRRPRRGRTAPPGPGAHGRATTGRSAATARRASRVHVRGVLPGGRRDSRHRRPALRQPLPLHRLPAHPRRDGRRARRARDEPDRFQLALHAPPLRRAGRSTTRRAGAVPAADLARELARAATRIPERALVAGATEIGVDINKKVQRFPLLISTEGVARARAFVAADDGAQWIVRRRGHAHRHRGGARWRASRRSTRCSRCSPRGRSATAPRSPATSSPPRPSATWRRCCSRWTRRGAALARGARTCRSPDFFIGYRKTALRRTRSSTPCSCRGASAPGSCATWCRTRSPSGASSTSASSPRRFASISDAAGVVRHARLAYGGVAATPIACARGRGGAHGQALDRATPCEAAIPLAREFTPIDDVARAPRTAAALVSLFEKFFDGAESDVAGRPRSSSTTSLRVGRRTRRAALCSTRARHGHVTRRGAVRGRPGPAPAHAGGRGPCARPHAHARILAATPTDAARCRASSRCSWRRTSRARTTWAPLRHDEPLFADRRGRCSTATSSRVVVGESYEACRAAAARGGRVRAAARRPRDRRRPCAAQSFHTEPHVHHARRRATRALADGAAPRSTASSTSAARSTSTWRRTRRGPSAARTATCSSAPPRSTRRRSRRRRRTCSPSAAQQGGGAVAAHGRRLRRQGDAGQHLGGAGRARRGEDAAAGARAARPRLDMTLTGKRHPFHAQLRGGLRRRRARSSRRSATSSPTAAGRSTSPSRSCDRALFHLDNALLHPRRATSRAAWPRRTSSRTPPSAASAGRRACS